MKALLVAVVLLAGCRETTTIDPGAKASGPCGKSDLVHYTIEGTVSSADLTVTDATGTTQTTVDVPLMNKAGTFGITTCTDRAVSLAAQIRGNVSGTITCAIERNGQVVSTKTSSGSYAVVSCRG